MISDDDLSGNFEMPENFFFVQHKAMFYPAPLNPGDKIALISPASAVKEEYVEGAMDRIREFGYEPVLMPHALGHVDGSFAADRSSRLNDLFEALQDPQYKAILCTRGGYGSCQLSPNFSYGMVASNPKWMIGFSDISALLALWNCSDIAGIHGPMAKHLATMPADDFCTRSLFNMLANGGKFDYTVAPHELNRTGKAVGTLRGGNLATLTDLAATPIDVLQVRAGEDVILFLEDINEPIYKVNRMLWRMYLDGTLMLVKGLIFGQFSDYKPDKNFNSMEEMINRCFERDFFVPSYPIVFNFPTGHTDVNLPLTVGAKVELEVTDTEVNLRTVF